MAAFTTPGPEIPTLITVSASPTPWKAPAMKGLSSTAFAKTTSFAQPKASSVFAAKSFIVWPQRATASIFIPALLEPTLIDPQTKSVWAKAFGIDLINISSAFVIPFSTRAEKPPIKSTPMSLAALSRTVAKGV